MYPDASIGGSVLVNVVAQKEHEAQVFVSQMFVRGEVSDLVVLARREGEFQTFDCRARNWECPGPADRAQFVTDAEPVPIPAFGLQPYDFDVNGVGPLGTRGCSSMLHDVGQLIVERDFR